MWNVHQQFTKMVNIDNKLSKAGLLLDYRHMYMKQVNKWKTKNQTEVKRSK